MKKLIFDVNKNQVALDEMEGHPGFIKMQEVVPEASTLSKLDLETILLSLEHHPRCECSCMDSSYHRAALDLVKKKLEEAHGT